MAARRRGESRPTLLGSVGRGLAGMTANAGRGILESMLAKGSSVLGQFTAVKMPPAGNLAPSAFNQVAPKTLDPVVNALNGVGGKRGMNYLSNNTAPEIRQALVSQTAEIRGSLPLELRVEGNLAVAKINVPGLPQEMRAFSRFDHGELGFAPLPIGPTILEPMAIGKGGIVNGSEAYLRNVDGEFKILENIARALGDNPSATGQINLFTELQSCTSCAGAVMQFRQRYPGIQLNVFTGKQ